VIALSGVLQVSPEAPALTGQWVWEILLIAVMGLVGTIVGGFVVKQLSKAAEINETQERRLADLKSELHACELTQAKMESQFATREQMEGRVMRLEDMLKHIEMSLNDRIDKLATRLHQRLDQIAVKLGVETRDE
jgi:hypothetical protein